MKHTRLRDNRLISNDLVNVLGILLSVAALIIICGLSEIHARADGQEFAEQEQSLETTIQSTYNLEVIDNAWPQLLSYQSQNIDPMILLSVNSTAPNGIYTINAVITCDEDTGGQVYWAKPGEAITGEKIIAFSLEEGTNPYTFIFESNEPVDKIRFDVGNNAGYFIIDDFSLTVKQGSAESIVEPENDVTRQGTQQDDQSQEDHATQSSATSPALWLGAGVIVVLLVAFFLLNGNKKQK